MMWARRNRERSGLEPIPSYAENYSTGALKAATTQRRRVI